VTVPEEAPVVLPRPMPARGSLFRSRLALAASVALLLAGGWMLSGSFAELNTAPIPSLNQGEATNVKLWIEERNGRAVIRVRAQQPDAEKPADRKIVDDFNEQLPKP
jgi:hypothetical protein